MRRYGKYLFLFVFLLIVFSNPAFTSSGKGIKNVILFIGDGMGLEHIRGGGMYLNGEQGTLIFESFPYQGTVTTYSADNEITDSAASSTAMATGQKVNNGTISMAFPGDGSELTTILEYNSSWGRSTGLVTTVVITHATPAAFGAHEQHRTNLDEIAVDYFTQTRPTLLLGGGGVEFGISPKLARTNGYTVVTTKEELLALTPTLDIKVSGQFGDGNMPYFDSLPPEFPTLREMTEAALSILEKNRSGFFLMVEGGLIDYASHEKNIKKMIKELVEFNAAVSYAYEWAQDRTDTLIVVTADHETGGLNILKNNGKGILPDVVWEAPSHTARNVGIFAYGAPADVEGVINNIDIFSVLRFPAYTLTVQSTPVIGLDIMVSPADNFGSAKGSTGFSRIYNEGTYVTLTAPYLYNGLGFSGWEIDGKVYTGQSIHITVNAERTVTANYIPLTTGEMNISRTILNFGYTRSRSLPPSQSIIVSREGTGTLKWTAASESGWITMDPSSGSGNGIIAVSVNPTGLTPGYYTGIITVTDADAPQSARDVSVNLAVKKYSREQPPFGSFDGPVSGSIVSSSIPVTGWALDDVGLQSVKIYREPAAGEGNNLVYIGDSYLVEGARPDVELAYPDFPNNYKAGWGYMLLTNFLPAGNGTFTLHAAAADVNGNTVFLGMKTITVNNIDAVNPFGAIDTPGMGQTVSGENFRNLGWVLAPQPHTVPLDGSTIKVFVDGIELGHSTYNIYREDIAVLFPGYSNSDGALAYFDFDTGFFRDGIHTIAWVVSDSAGNSDGIGSRYFTIRNTDKTGSRVSRPWSGKLHVIGENSPASVKLSPVKYWTGIGEGNDMHEVFPDTQGILRIRINELERMGIKLSSPGVPITGYMVVGNQFRPLPIGSTLDEKTGTFYWMPGPGFTGEYELVFFTSDRTGGGMGHSIIKIKIEPGL